MINERHERILEILNENGRASVSELAGRLFVCEMTIRRDLKQLADEKRVKRYKGGAALFVKKGDFPFTDRILFESKEKIQLAEKAAVYVEDASVVYLDSSSTCSYLVPHLSLKKNIRLVTNSVPVMTLAMQYNIPCVMAGGECYGKDKCTVGSFAIDMLEKINVDIAFFSFNAISEDGLVTDRDFEQTAVKKAVLRRAARSVIIMTKVKQNKTEMLTVCRSEDVFKVICG